MAKTADTINMTKNILSAMQFQHSASISLGNKSSYAMFIAIEKFNKPYKLRIRPNP